MATEDTEQTEATPDNVIMSKADYIKISEAMATYKEIEQRYLAMRSNVMRRVLTTFVLSDMILFFALWLGFFDWDEALAWTGLTFAAQEMVLALVTFLGATLRGR